MSHEFFQELIEKEKKYRNLPIILSSSPGSNYVSKRILTRNTDKLFKSMNFSNKKPQETVEPELLAIKQRGFQGKSVDKGRKTPKMRKIRLVQGHRPHEGYSLNSDLSGNQQISRNFIEEQQKLAKIQRRSQKEQKNTSKKEPKEKIAGIYEKIENTEGKCKENESESKESQEMNQENQEITQENPEINQENQENEDNLQNEVEKAENSENNETEIANCGNKTSEPLSKTEYFKILNIGYQHLKTYRLPLEKLKEVLKENQEYFKHLAGACKCYKCTCGLHKCGFMSLKFTYNLPLKTAYREDFGKKSNSLYSSPALKADSLAKMGSDYKTQAIFSNESTTKSDYKDPHIIYAKNPGNRADSREESPLFYKYSHYQREFLDYGANTLNLAKTSQDKTVIPDLPFYGSTTYKETFLNFSGKKNRIDINLPALPHPLKSDAGYINTDTTNQREYKPYHTIMTPEKFAYKSKKDLNMQTLAIPGQYRSTFSKDFLEIPKKKCPFSSEIN